MLDPVVFREVCAKLKCKPTIDPSKMPTITNVGFILARQLTPALWPKMLLNKIGHADGGFMQTRLGR